ncbi:hypothetical protein K2X33_05595 [bacterium]|nr:hypothetical protein [bacterium]
MARVAKPRREKSASKSKASVRKVVEKTLTPRVKVEAAPKAAAPISESQGSASSKKVSQKFLEAMEKRKAQGGWGAKKTSPFGRPVRRGRRPRASNTEYTPENSNNEEAYVLENEYDRHEHDTGVQQNPRTGGDDAGFSLDRFDDFDEELNFDR